MPRTIYLPLLWVVLSASSGCDRKPAEPQEARPAPVTTPLPSSKPTDTPPTSPSTAREVVWNDPPGWEKVAPSSPMRKATYKIPAAPKDPEGGEMAVFYFRGEGGGTEANIQRWIAQFSDAKPADAKRSVRNVGGMNQTIVEVEGTYASGMPGAATTPKTHYRLIGAVVETPAGPYFFKLTGPKNTVEAARGACMTMLDSVRPG